MSQRSSLLAPITHALCSVLLRSKSPALREDGYLLAGVSQDNSVQESELAEKRGGSVKSNVLRQSVERSLWQMMQRGLYDSKAAARLQPLKTPDLSGMLFGEDVMLDSGGRDGEACTTTRGKVRSDDHYDHEWHNASDTDLLDDYWAEDDMSEDDFSALDDKEDYEYSELDNAVFPEDSGNCKGPTPFTDPLSEKNAEHSPPPSLLDEGRDEEMREWSVSPKMLDDGHPPPDGLKDLPSSPSLLDDGVCPLNMETPSNRAQVVWECSDREDEPLIRHQLQPSPPLASSPPSMLE